MAVVLGLKDLSKTPPVAAHVQSVRTRSITLFRSLRNVVPANPPIKPLPHDNKPSRHVSTYFGRKNIEIMEFPLNGTALTIKRDPDIWLSLLLTIIFPALYQLRRCKILGVNDEQI